MIHHGICRAQAVMLGIGLGITIGSGALAQNPAPVVNPKSPAAVKIVARLKEACATKPDLLGILVQGGEVANGVLRLSGTVDRKDQLAILEAEASRILGEEPSWKAQIPGGASAAGMPTLPVRSELLLKLRHDFASAAAGRPNLQQIRLDDFAFDPSGALKVTGICVDPRAFVEGRKDKLSVQGQIASEVSVRLKAYPLPAGVPMGVLRRVNASGVEIKEDPARRLQTLALGTPGLDELLFMNSRFDEKGGLRFEGWLAKEERRAAVAALVARVEIARDYSRPGDAGTADHSADVAGMVVHPWRAALLAGMQARFARPGNKGTNLDAQRYCRLDRAWFDYGSQGGGLRLHFEGVVLVETGADAQDPIVAFLTPESRRLLQAAKPPAYNASSDLKLVPHPRRALQEKVAAEPSVDGVRIDDLTFGPDGKTTLEGVWVGENQAAVLDGVLRHMLAELTGGKVGGPIAHRFTPVPTDQILRDLRSKTAAAFDEASLDRLSFQLPDEKSPPAPVVLGSAPELRVKDVKAKVDGWLKADGRTKELNVPSVGVAIAGRPGSLLKEIRTLVSGVPALDGVRVDRAYFDETNTLTLTGRYDRDGQVAQTLTLVSTAVANTWPRQPPMTPAHAGLFANVPLSPTLAWLRRVLPNYPASDWVVISRAFYGPDGVLTFGGKAVGDRAQNPPLEKLIKDLMKVDLNKPVRLALSSEIRDGEKSTRIVGKGIDALAGGQIGTVPIEELDDAVFHNPTDPYAWYLRGAYHHVAGDADLARRDLGRVKRLGGAGRAGVVRFQGPLRVTLDALVEATPPAR